MAVVGCPRGILMEQSALHKGARPFQTVQTQRQSVCSRRASCNAARRQQQSPHSDAQQARSVTHSPASWLINVALAAGGVLLQPAAAAAIDYSGSAVDASTSGVAITSGVNAVLQTQQDSLPAEELKPAPAPSGAGPQAEAAGQEKVPQDEASATAAQAGRRVFLDVAVDGQEKGRIVVQLYDDVPVGAARFVDLAQGKQGVGFRRAKFDAINPEFLRVAPRQRLNFGSELQTPIAGGDGVEQLEVEIQAESAHRHSGRGDVSLAIRTDKPLETREKLTAYRGKLVKVQETLGEKANGTSFAITLKAVPSLDATNLVVGKVVDGMDTVEALAALPTVKDNQNSGYIKAAKLIGDRRADVAVRAFGRPFNKITVAECGPLN